MEVVYIENDDIYRIDLEYSETQLYIKAKNIAEARDIFIESMTRLFDYTICDKLKDCSKVEESKESHHNPLKGYYKPRFSVNEDGKIT